MPCFAECFSQLCDLTHPGASSVWVWLRPKGELELELATGGERETTGRFLSEYETMYVDLFMTAFNMPIITLAVLNYFPVPEYHRIHL